MNTPDELAWSLRFHLRYATDASGHEHEPAGRPTGGQFTGKAEHGQSPDDMASKLKPAEQQTSAQTSNDEYSSVFNNVAKQVVAHMGSYGDEPIDHSIFDAMIGQAGVSPQQIEQTKYKLIDDGLLRPHESEDDKLIPGVVSLAMNELNKHWKDYPDEPIDDNLIGEMIGNAASDIPRQELEEQFGPDWKQAVIDKMFDNSLIAHTPDEDPNNGYIPFYESHG